MRSGTTPHSRRISLKTQSKWPIFCREFFKCLQELTVEPVLAIGRDEIRELNQVVADLTLDRHIL